MRKIIKANMTNHIHSNKSLIIYYSNLHTTFSPLTCGSPTMMESWGPGRTGTPSPGLPPPPLAGSNNNGGATTSAIIPSVIPQPGTTAPIASPEGVSDVSRKNIYLCSPPRARDRPRVHRDQLTDGN